MISDSNIIQKFVEDTSFWLSLAARKKASESNGSWNVFQCDLSSTLGQGPSRGPSLKQQLEDWILFIIWESPELLQILNSLPWIVVCCLLEEVFWGRWWLGGGGGGGLVEEISVLWAGERWPGSTPELPPRKFPTLLQENNRHPLTCRSNKKEPFYFFGGKLRQPSLDFWPLLSHKTKDIGVVYGTVWCFQKVIDWCSLLLLLLYHIL